MRRIEVEFVRPCGLRCEPRTGRVVRFGIGVDQTEDGSLLAEARAGRHPVPWQSPDLQEAAVDQIQKARWLDDEDKRLMLGWILKSPVVVAIETT